MNKVILITGASSGIGKASFDFLNAQGHIVYGTSRKQTDSDYILQMDVTDKVSIKQTINQIYSNHGKIEVLINNAGMSLVGAIEDTADSEARNIMETNFWGVVNVTQSVLPIMRKQGSGQIINISSLAGLFSIPFQGYYSAAKFGLEGWTEALRMEVSPFNIQVSLIEPGDFETEIFQNRIVIEKAEGSPYAAWFENALDIIVKGERQGDNPIKIAKLVERIINLKRPKVRYTVGKPLDVLASKLKKVLPQKLFEKLIKDHYQL